MGARSSTAGASVDLRVRWGRSTSRRPEWRRVGPRSGQATAAGAHSGALPVRAAGGVARGPATGTPEVKPTQQATRQGLGPVIRHTLGCHKTCRLRRTADRPAIADAPAWGSVPLNLRLATPSDALPSPQLLQILQPRCSTASVPPPLRVAGSSSWHTVGVQP